MALTAATAPAVAQDEGELPATFTSDRPGYAFTDAVATVGRLTTEMGLAASFGVRDGEPMQGVLGNLNLRFGVYDWLELRLRGPNVVGVFPPDSGAYYGVSDMVAGFKVGGRPHETVGISSVWELSVPIGTDGFGAPEAQWHADVQLTWNFWGPLSVTPNAVAEIITEGVDPVSGETVRIFEGAFSLKVSWQIIDVVTVFVQSFVEKSETSDWRAHVGGGVIWMVLPNLQVDATFDSRVTEQGDDPVVNAGTTILW